MNIKVLLIYQSFKGNFLKLYIYLYFRKRRSKIWAFRKARCFWHNALNTSNKINGQCSHKPIYILWIMLIKRPWKGGYLVSRPFPCCRRIMVSLEYLSYYCKLLNHIWQLYTLGVGKFFHMFKFDLWSLSRSHDQKIVFSGTPGCHRSSGKSTDRRGF